MSVPALLGLADSPSEQQVEVEYNGRWIPLLLTPGSMLAKNPIYPFSPAVQHGDAQRVLDQRLNVRVWDDWSGGMGELRANPNNGLVNYAYGTLDARTPGYLVLPPALTLTGTLPGSIAGPAHVQYLPTALGGSDGVLVWSEGTAGVWLKQGATSANAFAAIASLAAVTVKEFGAFNGNYYIVSSGLHIYRSTDGNTWTDTASPYLGLAIHDNALFTYNTSDKKLYKSTDGTTFAAYSAAIGATGSGVVALQPGEVVRQVFTWTVPSGQGFTLYLLTTQRLLVLEEEPGYWHQFYPPDETIGYPVQSSLNRAHVWPRNNFAYVTFYNATDGKGLILVHNGGTTDEVGPWDRAGLPENWFKDVAFVQGNIHELFAFGTGGTLADGSLSYGNIMSMNELGAWHTVLAGEQMNLRTIAGGNPYIVGGGYANQVLYVVMSNGEIWRAPAPDRKYTHPRLDATYYDTAEHLLRSSWDDGGLTNVWKVGAYFVVDAQLADGSSGVPAGSQVKLRYRTDESDWRYLALLGSLTTDTVGLLLMQSLEASSILWPVLQVLPDGTTQQGQPFKRIQWEAHLQRSGGSSPALVEVSLYYALWLEQFYSYGFNADLREETYNQYPGGRVGGYTREDVLAALLDITSRRTFFRLRYGPAGREEVVPAADMLLSFRGEPNQSDLIVGVALRDLRAPALH